MNKRLLSMSMIVPLAAAGAVATAPAASADDHSVKCTLTKAWSDYKDDDIKLKLNVKSHGSQGDYFKVRIYQNGKRIEKKDWYYDKNGDFNIYERADNKDGWDRFSAYVYNYKTHDDDWCYKTVKSN